MKTVAEKRGRGKPTKLTSQSQDAIVTALRMGNYKDTAAAMGGIDYSTMRVWINRGEHEGEGIYFDFAEAVKRAELEAEAASVAVIRKHSLETWQAAAWLLERRSPEKWGRRDYVQAEMTGKSGAPIAVILDLGKDAI